MGEGEEINVGEEERENISLKDLSKKLEEFAKARDWEKYHSPRNLLLAMVIKSFPITILRSSFVLVTMTLHMFLCMMHV